MAKIFTYGLVIGYGMWFLGFIGSNSDLAALLTGIVSGIVGVYLAIRIME